VSHVQDNNSSVLVGRAVFSVVLLFYVRSLPWHCTYNQYIDLDIIYISYLTFCVFFFWHSASGSCARWYFWAHCQWKCPLLSSIATRLPGQVLSSKSFKHCKHSKHFRTLQRHWKGIAVLNSFNTSLFVEKKGLCRTHKWSSCRPDLRCPDTVRLRRDTSRDRLTDVVFHVVCLGEARQANRELLHRGWLFERSGSLTVEWANKSEATMHIVHSIAFLFPKATNGLMRTHPRRDFSHHSWFPSFWSSQLLNFSTYQRVSPRTRDSAFKMLCPVAPSKPSTYLGLEHFAIRRRQIPSLFGAFGGPLFAGYCRSDRHDPNVCRKHMSSRFQGWFPRWTSWRQQHWASKDSIKLLELLETGLCMLCHPRLSR